MDCQLSILDTCKVGRLGETELLIVQGKADTEAKDDEGLTPLHLAWEGGHVNVVKLLLDQGKANAEAKGGAGLTQQI